MSANLSSRLNAAAAEAATVRGALTYGFHEPQGHHPNCATREDEGCDCYARSTVEARTALAGVVALLREAATALEAREAALREIAEAASLTEPLTSMANLGGPGGCP